MAAVQLGASLISIQGALCATFLKQRKLAPQNAAIMMEVVEFTKKRKSPKRQKKMCTYLQQSVGKEWLKTNLPRGIVAGPAAASSADFAGNTLGTTSTMVLEAP